VSANPDRCIDVLRRRRVNAPLGIVVNRWLVNQLHQEQQLVAMIEWCASGRAHIRTDLAIPLQLSEPMPAVRRRGKAMAALLNGDDERYDELTAELGAA
jgi:hypothetical protein